MHGGKKDQSFFPALLGRLFIAEGISSFILVENDELREYVQRSNLIQTYLKKVSGEKK